MKRRGRLKPKLAEIIAEINEEGSEGTRMGWEGWKLEMGDDAHSLEVPGSLRPRKQFDSGDYVAQSILNDCEA
jgi:hypothetical protein